MNSCGETTQPCGEPVEVNCMSEKMLLTWSRCDLWVRKSRSHRMSWSSRWKEEESLLARMWGWRVLNAEEKSANRSLAEVLGRSKCSWRVSRMNILASSTPLLVRYANWRGSIGELVAFVMWCFTIFSIDIITREVRATSLRSLSVFGGTLLGDRDDCRVFPQLGYCPIIKGRLEQGLKNIFQLLGTVPQSTNADVVWSRRACLFGSPEGSHYVLCGEREGRVFGLECFFSFISLHGVVFLKPGEEGVEWIFCFTLTWQL